MVKLMNPSMLVLVTTSFPIAADGSEAAGSFVADLVEELAKHTHVRVVAPGAADSRERWSEQVEIYRYAAPAKPLSTLKIWLPQDLYWIARTLRGGFRATNAAGEEATHILAMWGLPCGEWARRVAHKYKIHYSCWLLGSDVWSLGRVPIVRSILARVIRQSDPCYADGYKLAADAHGISRSPIKFLPSTRAIGSEPPLPPRNTAPFRLLFLGRWHRNKGIDMLLEALGQLNDADWELVDRIDIYGGGPLEKFVRDRVLELTNNNRPVAAGGFLNKEQAEQAISQCDMVLIPSRIESIPVIFSDAMKLGRPVIATPTGDMPRLVTHGCGQLCKEISTVSLLQTIRAALRSEHQYIADAIKRRADQFSIKTVASQIIESATRSYSHD